VTFVVLFEKHTTKIKLLDSIEKHIQRIYQLFGAERFFWGSDITKLKCTWRQSIDLFINEYQWISAEEKSLVMGRALTQWLSWDID
jgi:predicted TIM-barrel fold metal-dependent hydrolase